MTNKLNHRYSMKPIENNVKFQIETDMNDLSDELSINEDYLSITSSSSSTSITTTTTTYKTNKKTRNFFALTTNTAQQAARQLMKLFSKKQTTKTITTITTRSTTTTTLKAKLKNEPITDNDDCDEEEEDEEEKESASELKRKLQVKRYRSSHHHNHHHPQIHHRIPIYQKNNSKNVKSIQIKLDNNHLMNSSGLGFTIIGYCPCQIGKVEPNSIAFNAGLQAGDLIIKINGKNVSRATSDSIIKIIK
jgi:C-terminal processing protease CtpA/Prc